MCFLSFSAASPRVCHSFLGNELCEVRPRVEHISQGTVIGIMRPSHPHYSRPWEIGRRRFYGGCLGIHFILSRDPGKCAVGWTSMWFLGSSWMSNSSMRWDIIVSEIDWSASDRKGLLWGPHTDGPSVLGVPCCWVVFYVGKIIY